MWSCNSPRVCQPRVRQHPSDDAGLAQFVSCSGIYPQLVEHFVGMLAERGSAVAKPARGGAQLGQYAGYLEGLAIGARQALNHFTGKVVRVVSDIGGRIGVAGRDSRGIELTENLVTGAGEGPGFDGVVDPFCLL